MGRFHYVKYDDQANETQNKLRELCEGLETEINVLPEGRPKATALTKLEECFMWIGKTVRDDQIARYREAKENRS